MSRRSGYAMDRRSFVKALLGTSALGLTRTPLMSLLDALTRGLVNDAAAQSLGINPRRYVVVELVGGPPRWLFDLALKPSGNDSFVANDYVTTKISSGNSGYQTTQVGDFHYSSLWASSLPTTGGGTVAMSSLLANMGTLRGVNMQADGHEPNRIKQVMPVASAPSLTGMVADHSTHLFSSVTTRNQGAFRSGTGLAQTFQSPSSENPLQGLFTAFNDAGRTSGNPAFQTFFSRRDLLKEAMSMMTNSLADHYEARSPGSVALRNNVSQAERKLLAGVAGVAAEWAPLVGKYRALITAVAKDKAVPGIMDGAIKDSVAGRRRVALANPATIVDPGVDFDARALVSDNSSVSNLAESFAIAEYLLMNDLSSSIHLSVGEPSGPHPKTGVMTRFNMDMHGQGRGSALVISAFYYRSLAACLHEFTNVLKNKALAGGQNLFDETVIHLCSEFSRSPRSAGEGSDHGWGANVTSLISGAINTPFVAGNIYTTPNNETFRDDYSNATYGGTWGLGAPVKVDNGDNILHAGYAASAVAAALRVESPNSNFVSVLTEGVGGLKPASDLGKPRNVS